MPRLAPKPIKLEESEKQELETHGSLKFLSHSEL